MHENRILRRIAGHCIEDTGGLFVSLSAEDSEYGDRFAAGCVEAGIPVEEIEPAAALRREPRLHPGIQRAFAVPDASVDGWRLLWGCADDVERRGGAILTYHEVEGLVVEGDRVCGAHVRDMRTGEGVEIRADITVSAAGAQAWSESTMSAYPEAAVTRLPIADSVRTAVAGASADG